jgi:aubergine-like protein
MTPKSTFENVRAQKKQSFIEYYKTTYQCTIKDENQPLIQVKVKNCQKEEIQFLVPELVCLTGLTDDQRADFHVMKAVAEKTKLRVDERVAETHGIVAELNKKGTKDLSFEIS